jgi:hypothetical protein
MNAHSSSPKSKKSYSEIICILNRKLSTIHLFFILYPLYKKEDNNVRIVLSG